MMAPEVANQAAPVAGIVMLAPAGRQLPAVIVQQMRYLGQASPEELADLERQADEISAHKMPPAQYFSARPPRTTMTSTRATRSHSRAISTFRS